MKGIGFKNMKVIKDEYFFDFAPITLLTGTNNSGKSSVLNGIELIIKNVQPIFNSIIKELDKDTEESFVTLGSRSESALDHIFSIEFELGDLEKKYGTLEKFINYDSKNKNFSFCFKEKIDLGIKKEIYNVYVEIEIIGESIKRGIVSKLEIKSSDNLVSVLEITRAKIENNDSDNTSIFKTKFNFLYLAERFGTIYNEIKDQYKEEFELFEILYNNDGRSIDEAIIKYNTNDKRIHVKKGFDRDPYRYLQFKVSDDFYNQIKKEGKDHDYQRKIVNGAFVSIYKMQCFHTFSLFKNSYDLIDFSEVFEHFPDFENKFMSILNEHYGKPKKESYELFKKDFLKYISKYSVSVINKISITFLFKLFSTNQLLDLINYEFNIIINDFFREKELFYVKNKKQTDANIKGFETFHKNVIEKIILLSSNSAFISENLDYLEEYIYLSDISVSLFDEFFSKTIVGKYLTNFSNLNTLRNFSKNINFISTGREIHKRNNSFEDLTVLAKSIKKIETIIEDKEACNKFINEWINKFGIGDEFYIKTDDYTGEFQAFLKKDGKESIINDLGLGSNQLLPIILAIAAEKFSGKKEEIFFIIEEPEANLHPALQSKLADFLAETIKTSSIKIIVETHSEYLIRKLQYLTAKGEVKPEDTVIYYFYDPNHPAVLNNDVEQIKKITINEKGALSDDFGTGFFDEADNIALELFLLKNHQKN